MSIRATWIFLAVIHAIPAAVGLRFGMLPALAVMFAFHVLLVAAIFLPVVIGVGCGVRCFRAAGREVCITIDDGPTSDTQEILSILDRAGVRALFFLIGTRVAKEPELCRRIVAGGHEVGNHTMTHATAWFWSLLPSAQMREISCATKEIESAAGVRPRFFRAPVGFRNLFNEGVLRTLGMRHVGWSARGFDGVDTDVERIVARIMRSLKPGAIILLHQGRPHHVAVMRRLLDELRSGGWSVVIPEVLRSRNPR